MRCWLPMDASFCSARTSDACSTTSAASFWSVSACGWRWSAAGRDWLAEVRIQPHVVPPACKCEVLEMRTDDGSVTALSAARELDRQLRCTGGQAKVLPTRASKTLVKRPLGNCARCADTDSSRPSVPLRAREEVRQLPSSAVDQKDGCAIGASQRQSERSPAFHVVAVIAEADVRHS